MASQEQTYDNGTCYIIRRSLLEGRPASPYVEPFLHGVVALSF